MQKYVSLIAFLQKLISKEHVIVIMEFPDWVQVKKYLLYLIILVSNFVWMGEDQQQCD